MKANARNLFVIHCHTTNPNRTNYRNANRFVHSIAVIGNEALQTKIAELQAAGIKIAEIRNGCGEPV